MHDTTARTKDGKVYCGPIYEWRPREGWFSIPSDPDAPEKIYFRDLQEAGKVDRISVHSPPEGEYEDLLAKARRDGWDGT